MTESDGVSQTPLNSAFTRLFFLIGRARPDHRPVYKGFHKMGGYNQGLGGINPIYVPSNTKRGDFVQAGTFRDEKERPTSSLMSHYAANVKSDMIALSKANCPFDLIMNIGLCTDPTVLTEFTKLLIFEEVFLESISSDDLGALEPGEQGKVDETGDISAKDFYEYLPMNWADRTPSVVTNRLVGVVRGGNESCGDCDDENSGCQDFYAVSLGAGGSPGTPADVVFTLDKGLTSAAYDIDTIATGDDPTDVSIMGRYLVVTSADTESLHLALLSGFRNGPPTWVEVGTGFVANAGPNSIWTVGSVAFIVGNLGYIYKSVTPTAGVSVLDAGVSTTADLRAVHAISEGFAVAVGDDGAIVAIENDFGRRITTSPVGIGTNIISVDVVSTKEWAIGTDTGKFYVTLDGGVSWQDKSADLAGTKTAVTAIRHATSVIRYVTGTVGGAAAVWSSVDGGFSYQQEDRASGVIPSGDAIDAIAVCHNDPDFLMAVGLGANGTDGFILVGSD